jgi:hypothetical protein
MILSSFQCQISKPLLEPKTQQFCLHPFTFLCALGVCLLYIQISGMNSDTHSRIKKSINQNPIEAKNVIRASEVLKRGISRCLRWPLFVAQKNSQIKRCISNEASAIQGASNPTGDDSEGSSDT